MLGLALGLAVAGYVALSATRRSPIGFAGWRLDVPRPAIAAAQIALSLLDWVLAAAVLYVLLLAAWRSASRPSLACSGSPIWAG